MEKRGGYRMVNGLKWTTVSCGEIEQAKYRLEASVFNVEAKVAKEAIEKCSSEKVTLCGDNGLAEAYHRGRFKRIYVEKSQCPIFQPSQITEVNPKPFLYLSEHTDTDIEALRVERNQILMTCSGTIGKCTIATGKLVDQVFSHDLLRITAKEPFDTGYIYAYLKTDVGQLVLQTNNYGAVIQHIEPVHLENVVIPKPKEELRKSIHNKIMQSFALRDESNELIDKAEKLLIEALRLPPIDKIKEEHYKPNAGIKNYTVRLCLLDERFEATYHNSLNSAIIDYLLDNSTVKQLTDKSLIEEAYIPYRFKRIYVEDESIGIPFFSGKSLLELDPSNKKYISKSFHSDRIANQLTIRESMILMTCSGTTGKVNIVPKCWDGWVMTHDIIRIIPQKNMTGYLYIWLNTDYAKQLIESKNYGSVVSHIEIEHLEKIPVPILKDKDIQKEINDLALRANELRSQAYYLEQEAIKQVNDEVIYS